MPAVDAFNAWTADAAGAYGRPVSQVQDRTRRLEMRDLDASADYALVRHERRAAPPIHPAALRIMHWLNPSGNWLALATGS